MAALSSKQVCSHHKESDPVVTGGGSIASDCGCMSAKLNNVAPVRASIVGPDNRNSALNPGRLVLSDRFELLSKIWMLCRIQIQCCRGLYVRMTERFGLLGVKVLVKHFQSKYF